MTGKLCVAVIGTGHLGRHHARNLGSMEGVELVAVCDPSEERGRAAAEMGRTQWCADVDALGDVDAVSIAAPTSLHFALAERFLARGVHCLIEKPMTATLDEARRLAAIAERSGCVVQVGHIERFNPVLDEFPTGFAARLLDLRRLAPHPKRSLDTSVVFDLMIHDIDLALWFARSQVVEVTGARAGVLVGPHADWAAATLRFANGAEARLTASRVAGEAVRRTTLYGDDGTVELDFGKRRLWTVTKDGAREFAGSDEEPLRRELLEFVTAARGDATPRVGVAEGLAAIEVADRIIRAGRT